MRSAEPDIDVVGRSVVESNADAPVEAGGGLAGAPVVDVLSRPVAPPSTVKFVRWGPDRLSVTLNCTVTAEFCQPLTTSPAYRPSGFGEVVGTPQIVGAPVSTLRPDTVELAVLPAASVVCLSAPPSSV